MNLDWPAWVLGVFIGGILGALLALFAAPSSGEQIRERLWETSIDWRDRTEELAADYLAHMSPVSTRTGPKYEQRSSHTNSY